MATLGQQLKAAREAKGASESEAGSATNILTKIIIAMEADDFSVMPAPTYAKGFIRLYAKYLGLAPAPLVDEYLADHATGPRPLLDESSQLEQNSRASKPVAVNLQKMFVKLPRIALAGKVTALFSKRWSALPSSAWKDVRVLAVAVAVLLILIVLISSLSNCARRSAAEKPETPVSQTAPARLLLDEPVPDLYLIEPGKIESN